ncbi:MAG: DUF167 family protein [Hyphomicrobiaceae bacterium]
MDADDVPWRQIGDGLVVRIRVTPKSSRDTIEGIEATPEGAAVKARVRAVPSEGAANTALATLFAKWLGIPKANVALVAGSRSRIKSLAVRGEPAQLARDLAAKLGH